MQGRRGAEDQRKLFMPVVARDEKEHEEDEKRIEPGPRQGPEGRSKSARAGAEGVARQLHAVSRKKAMGSARGLRRDEPIGCQAGASPVTAAKRRLTRLRNFMKTLQSTHV